MSSKSKKGRNPTAVDNWLDSIGLYRKNVAYDETCLFRAASEQLFECQIYHERVRRDCIEYGRSHYEEFAELLDNIEEWFDHLELLEKHMVVCGNIEMQIISQKYDCDIVVYDATNQKVIDITHKDLETCLTFCLMNEDHYDVVHQKEHIQNAGFCQSIVYNILYEDVFGIPNVQDIVRGMLYDKEFVAQSFAELNNNEDLQATISEKEDIKNILPGVNVAPFPFKVAKALDPTIYRNIEYDAWTEIRRELRLGDWYYGDDNLILGTKCILNQDDQTYECYIQEIIKNQNKCIVYVTKLAEKRTVNYTDLSPENDAKAWPLPYRFTKNLTVSTTQTSSADKPLKLPKKRKDKRRMKSNSETQTSVNGQVDQAIESLIGAPLQMQNGQVPPQQGTTPETPLSQHNLLITPDISSPMPKFSWDSPWSSTSSNSTEKVTWSQAGTSPNFNLKPMVPSSPSVASYPDPQYTYVYNYPIENYNGYGVWQGNAESTPPNGPYLEQEEIKENVEYAPNSQSESFETPRERPPNSQPVEVFSPIISVPAGTPVIYAQQAEVPELVIPPPFQVYTPTVDVQYISPTPYYYSPSVPTTWYPVGINSQGFIFPTPVNQNLQPN